MSSNMAASKRLIALPPEILTEIANELLGDEWQSDRWSWLDGLYETNHLLLAHPRLNVQLMNHLISLGSHAAAE